MPWVLAEYLDISNTPHDHQFAVRHFDTSDEAQRWAEGFGAPDHVMMRVMSLSGDATRPTPTWYTPNARNTLYHHDGISASVSPPSRFAWIGQGFVHNAGHSIVVNRWTIQRDGIVLHTCNPNRHWTRTPHRAMRDARNLSMYCGYCGQSVTYAWLRRRATSIATASRGGE